MSGRNGRTMPNHALVQVYMLTTHIFRLMYIADHSQNVQDSRSKVNRTRIQITTDANGEPELPSVDGYHSKIIQIALRDYCIAHMRECTAYSMQYCMTYASQGSYLERRKQRYRGRRYTKIRPHGFVKNAFRQGFRGKTLQRCVLVVCRRFWPTGGNDRKMDLRLSSGIRPVNCLLMLTKCHSLSLTRSGDIPLVPI